MEPGSSHWCQPLGHGQKLMHRKFLLTMRKNFTVCVIMHWNKLSREVWSETENSWQTNFLTQFKVLESRDSLL